MFLIILVLVVLMGFELVYLKKNGAKRTVAVYCVIGGMALLLLGFVAINPYYTRLLELWLP